MVMSCDVKGNGASTTQLSAFLLSCSVVSLLLHCLVMLRWPGCTRVESSSWKARPRLSNAQAKTVLSISSHFRCKRAVQWLVAQRARKCVINNILAAAPSPPIDVWVDGVEGLANIALHSFPTDQSDSTTQDLEQ